MSSKLVQRSASHRFVAVGLWFPGSIFTNPADTTVLVDTGALDEGDYLVGIHGATSADEAYDLQLRDASNTTNLKSERRRPVKGDVDWILPARVRLAQGQRLRCVQVGALTGEVQLSIFMQEIEPGPQ